MKNVFLAILSKISIRPVNASSVVEGVAIDTIGFNSAMVTIENGAVTGSPSSYTVDGKVQESDNGSTGWVDVTGATITQIVADNKSAQIPIEGLGLNRKRFLRAVVTPAITGGSTPKALVSATILLGDAIQEPVANSKAPA
ncbi:MAG: DUF1521 domain-containing protein [Candidatus Paceibacterota bacterium]